MTVVVLAKAVPSSEELRYDPDRRTVLRDPTELLLNPFDQRALRVALELRRPAEEVVVVSLGPPGARRPLREALALGARRALHLCDPAFAGSDLLATSRILAAAVRPLGPSLLLAGARSTDSDTGLLPAEVAGQLGLPLAASARAIVPEGADRLAVTVDAGRGKAEVVVRRPALVSVGEKIAKPLHATAEQYAQVDERLLETVDARALGLPVAEVGSAGSPTIVQAVRPAAFPRAGRVLADGPVDRRVAEAMVLLAPRLRFPPGPPPPLPWPPAPDPRREIVVLASGAGGTVEPGAGSLLAHLRHEVPAHFVTAAVYGSPPDRSAADLLESAGALAGYRLGHPGEPFDARDAAEGLGALVEARPKAAAVVLPATPFGREVAGRLAAARSLGAVGDATGVRAGPGEELLWDKPSFGGGTYATIRSRSRPTVATVPIGLAREPTATLPRGEIGWTDVSVPRPSAAVRTLGETHEAPDPSEVDRADVMVAVGLGVGGPEAIAALAPTLLRWGAAVVGTRKVVDAGWLPYSRQIGLTGRAAAPRLAVLLGVRGAANHMVGWQRAGAVLAVNRDPAAPALRAADVGLVATVEEAVPALAEPLALALGR